MAKYISMALISPLGVFCMQVLLFGGGSAGNNTILSTGRINSYIQWGTIS